MCHTVNNAKKKINLFLFFFLSRTFSITKYHDKRSERTYNNSGSLTEETTTATTTTTTSNNLTNGETVNDEKCDSTTNAATDVNAPEVFLGGSCNPTTWRADVAIPALNEFNISFYNPVSLSLNVFFLNFKFLICI